MIKDMTARTIGRLYVLGFSHINRNAFAVWSVQCACGNVLEAVGADMRRGHTLSCGCIQRETARENAVLARAATINQRQRALHSA